MTTDTTTPRPTPNPSSSEAHMPTPGLLHITHEPTVCTYHIRIEDLDAAPVASLFYSSAGWRPVLAKERIDANARLLVAAWNSYTRNTRDPLATAEGDLLRDLLELAEFFRDVLSTRAVPDKDRDYRAFRERWRVPDGMTLDEFSNRKVDTLLARAKAT